MGNVAKRYRAALWPRRSRVRTPPFPLEKFEQDLEVVFSPENYVFELIDRAYEKAEKMCRALAEGYGVEFEHCLFLYEGMTGDCYAMVSFGAPVNKEYYFKIS